MGEAGAVDGLLAAVHGARQGELVGAEGEMGVEDDGPVGTGLGEATGGLFRHPAGREHVHAQRQVGAVDLKGAGGEEGDGAVAAQPPDVCVGDLDVVHVHHGLLQSRGRGQIT